MSLYSPRSASWCFWCQSYGQETPIYWGICWGNLWGFPQLISAYFAITFEPETLENPSNPQ